jgi:poly-gamma-glutamate synthesis protein (capsule biosynthesis protein)
MMKRRSLAFDSRRPNHEPSQQRFRFHMHANSWLMTMAVLVTAGIALGDEPPVRKESPPGSVAVAFVGDIMLDNGPGHAIASGRDPFAACGAMLLDADFTVGNLECVLGRGGKQVLKEYSFRAATDSPKYLKRYFSGLSVANNHALDFGPDGLVECLRILAAEGIPQVGGGGDLAAARRPLVLEKHGIKVAILAANGFQAAKSAAGAATPGVAPLEEEAILADIAAARRQADFVVPFVHWGPELVAQPREADRALARRMIEAGAAAVIGGHPHITQTVEVHRGAPVVYSLGNFVFDYYPVDPPEWTGWVAKLTFAKGKPVELQTQAVVLDAAGLPRPVTEDD